MNAWMEKMNVTRTSFYDIYGSFNWGISHEDVNLKMFINKLDISIKLDFQKYFDLQHILMKFLQKYLRNRKQ